MLGNFTYCNPTKLYFGDDVRKNLNDELTHYGPKVLLTYGGGSIKRNGIYEEVIASLREALVAKKSGARCMICGAPIWAAGSGVTGTYLCFTCTTGEADDSEDYEIE